MGQFSEAVFPPRIPSMSSGSHDGFSVNESLRLWLIGRGRFAEISNASGDTSLISTAVAKHFGARGRNEWRMVKEINRRKQSGGQTALQHQERCARFGREHGRTSAKVSYKNKRCDEPERYPSNLCWKYFEAAHYKENSTEDSARLRKTNANEDKCVREVRPRLWYSGIS